MNVPTYYVKSSVQSKKIVPSKPISRQGSNAFRPGNRIKTHHTPTAPGFRAHPSYVKHCKIL